MSFREKLQQIDKRQEEIKNFGPIPENVLKKINYKFRLEWNYYSNVMEGNSLTRSETRSVMVGNITVGGKPIKDILEMKGHDEVILNILKIGKGELNISESRIKDIHKGIMHEEDPEKKDFIGKWKTDPNYLYNYRKERFDFVTPSDVPDRMHRLINWLNTQKEKIARGSKDALHPVELAFQFHLDYITIHPFYDGNGRTVRILTNLILISYGYPPLYIKDTEKGLYYQYLGDIQGYGGGPDLFYDFLGDMLIRSQEIVLNALKGKGVEEPDDWQKKLSLLKTTLGKDDHVKVSKSNDIILDVINNSIIPFLEKLSFKLNDFDELFASRSMVFGGTATQYVIQNFDQAKEKVLSEPGRFFDGVQFNYQLTGFKKNGTDTFSASVDIEWQFDDFKYLLFLNHREFRNAYAKLYHEYYSDEEIGAFINSCGDHLVGRIEEQISISKKE